MSRIPDLSRAQEGTLLRLTRRFARRKVAQITGRETERMLAPFEAYARARDRGCGSWWGSFQVGGVPPAGRASSTRSSHASRTVVRAREKKSKYPVHAGCALSMSTR